jgi:hypothetical protein
MIYCDGLVGSLYLWTHAVHTHYMAFVNEQFMRPCAVSGRCIKNRHLIWHTKINVQTITSASYSMSNQLDGRVIHGT